MACAGVYAQGNIQIGEALVWVFALMFGFPHTFNANARAYIVAIFDDLFDKLFN